jgi:hypothetical protein
MQSVNQEEGSYQVVLNGMEDNTEERKETFCKEISKHCSISFPLSKKIIDQCPVILKKNLSLNKAEELAKALQSIGAIVSVEEKEDSPDIFLEFQEMAPPRVALESSYLRKTQKGAWYVTGRGKNIFDGNLNDTWVLIQIFNDLEDLLTFEEAPIPINPIPPGEAFPFKAIFEEGLSIKRASIAFKHASGYPIPAVDRRRNREWVEDDQLPEQESPLVLSGENEGIEGEGEEQVSREEEPPPLSEEISIRTMVEKEETPFPWIRDFRNAVETYYQKHRDIFSIWFENYRRGGGFENSFHSLLTILVHARFHQVNQAEKSLENTQKVVRLIAQSNLRLEEIPLLEETPFFSGEDWRDLFHRAFPKLQQVANDILKQDEWHVLDLERLIQVIPHMSDKNSRLSIRWMHQFLPEVVRIDFSNTLIHIEESLYRVASRLGVVDPYFDYYRGRDSIGNLKIQTFAKTTFPQYPSRIEEPMTWVGREEEEGGHCFPTQPRCEGCLFEAFCPKLYFHFDPSGRGMWEREQSLEKDNGRIRPS